jgi:predicted DNA-binding protein with PD1-like motif
MLYFKDKQTGVIFVVLKNGDKLLESIRKVAVEADIHTGILISGIGSLQKGRMHTVASNDLPQKKSLSTCLARERYSILTASLLTLSRMSISP